jgi:hypothetical protein
LFRETAFCDSCQRGQFGKVLVATDRGPPASNKIPCGRLYAAELSLRLASLTSLKCSDQHLALSVGIRPAPASHEICKPARRPAATPSPMPFDDVCPTLGRVATRVYNPLASRIPSYEASRILESSRHSTVNTPARRPAATPPPMPFDGVCPTLSRVATRVTNRLASRIEPNFTRFL